MKRRHLNYIHCLSIGLIFLSSIACASVSLFEPATDIPSTNIPSPTATFTPTPALYSFFEVFKSFETSPEGIASMAFSPDGTILAYGDYGNNLVTMIDISTGETIQTLEGHTKPVTALAFSPDGKTFASTGTVNLPPEKDGSVRVWDVQTGKQLSMFETTGTGNLIFSPDSALLAGSVLGPVQIGKANDIQVIIWDVQSRSQTKSFKDVFNSLAFSPDGSLLATAARDNMIHIFDIKSETETMSLSAHTALVSTVDYSADGKLLASGGWDKSIYLWNTTTGNQQSSFIGHIGGVGLVKFSPEGTVLASLGDGFVFSQSEGQFTMTFADEDKFLRFWDIETGQQIGKIEMDGGISAVAFNIDWTMIATANSTGTIQLWKTIP